MFKLVKFQNFMAPSPLFLILLCSFTIGLSYINHLVGFPAYVLVQLPLSLVAWIKGEDKLPTWRRAWARRVLARFNDYPPSDQVMYTNLTSNVFASLTSHTRIQCEGFQAVIVTYHPAGQARTAAKNGNHHCSLSPDVENADTYVLYFTGGFKGHGDPFSFAAHAHDLAKWAFITRRKKFVVVIPWLPWSSSEVRFPVQQDVGMSAYRFLVKTSHISPSKIIFGGDFAGGTLALNLAMNDATPRSVFTISPWLDAEKCDRSKESSDVYTCMRMTLLSATYADRHWCKEAFPAQRTLQSQAKLPPIIYIWSGQDEILHKQSVEFVHTLQSQDRNRTVIFDAHPTGHNAFPLHDDPWIGNEAYEERKRIWMLVIDKL